MYSVFLSTFRKTHIQLIRLVDHLYRSVMGLPQFTRSEITPQLFVGGQYTRRGIRKMQQIGITAIVNMRETPLRSYPEMKKMNTLHLATKDLNEPTIQHLQRGVEFITQEIASGGKVYVHCRLGEGRGPTMAVAYLMSTGLRLEDAIETIQDVRPFISITKRQMDQLKKFEKDIHEEGSQSK